MTARPCRRDRIGTDADSRLPTATSCRRILSTKSATGFKTVTLIDPANRWFPASLFAAMTPAYPAPMITTRQRADTADSYR